MFQKNLTDLIRGIRSHKNNPEKYVLQQLEDLRNELKSTDLNVKTIALSKLNYLQMMGHQTHWASFHIVEVMASPNLSQKRIGYLTATSTFRQDTEVLMLTMNLVKKDLLAPNAFDVGIALGGLAQFMTADLAQFLIQDLLTLLNHSKPYVRKRAVLTLYPLFLKFPQGLRLGFPRLKEKLEDSDPSVVSSAVNVICELARKNPENFLGLAPQFYHLLTSSGNNWMVIKVVKLLGALTPLEPRLAKKLMVPLRNLIETTPAMSLLYECIHTVISGGLLHPNLGDAAKELATLCSVRLKLFLEDRDQNLKYIGLVALEGLLSVYPDLSSDHHSLVIACLDDFDYSVRIRALSIVKVMGKKEYLVEVFKRLMNQLGDVKTHEPTTVSSQSEELSFVMTDNYRSMVVESILAMGAKDTYANVPNFEWYLAVLMDLTYLAGVDVGDQLSYQFLDVSVRVKSIRSYSVRLATRLLQDTSLLEKIDSPSTNIKVLFAAAWICGEYNEYLMNPEVILTYLFRTQTPRLPFDVQSAYLQAALKIYYRFATQLEWSSSDASLNEFQKVTNNLLKSLEPLTTSIDVEVQERACNLVEILKVIQFYIAQNPNMADKFLLELASLFQGYELNAVAPKAQSKVPAPDDLDLDTWIHSPPPKPKVRAQNAFAKPELEKDAQVYHSETTPITKSSESSEEIKKRQLLRKKRNQNDPFYIDDRTYFDDRDDAEKLLPDVDSIPIVKLSEEDINVSSQGRRLESSLVYQNPTSPISKKKGNKKLNVPKVEIDQGEMPDGAVESDGENNQSKLKFKKQEDKLVVKDLLDIDTTSLSKVDLTTPLKEDEKLPEVKAYLTPDQLRQQQEEIYRAKQSKSSKSKKDGKTKEKKKKKKVKGSDKQPTTSSIVNDLADLDPIMSSSKKIRKKKSKHNELNFTPSQDDREEIKAFADPQLIEVTNAVVGTPQLEGTMLTPPTTSPILESHMSPKEIPLPFDIKQAPSSLQAIDTDMIKMEVNFELSESNSNNDLFQSYQSNSSPTLVTKFSLKNVSNSEDLDDIELDFLETPDIKVQGLNTWNLLKLDGSISVGNTKQVDVHLIPVDPELISNFNLNGSISYTSYPNGLRNNHQFNLSIPIRSWFLSQNKLDPITPEGFEHLVQNEDLTQCEVLVFELGETISLSRNYDYESWFDSWLPSLTNDWLKFQVVQQIEGHAATIWGQTGRGDKVVAMIKQVVKVSDTSSQSLLDSPTPGDSSVDVKIKVEYKGENRELVKALSRETRSFFEWWFQPKE